MAETLRGERPRARVSVAGFASAADSLRLIDTLRRRAN
jgi:hypothetical protein